MDYVFKMARLGWHHFSLADGKGTYLNAKIRREHRRNGAWVMRLSGERFAPKTYRFVSIAQAKLFMALCGLSIAKH